MYEYVELSPGRAGPGLAGSTYFFTVNILELKHDLLVRHIDLLREAVRRVIRQYSFEIIAWVVLPNHMHCIWKLPKNDVDFAVRLRLIKLLFSKGLPKPSAFPAAEIKEVSAVSRQRIICVS